MKRASLLLVWIFFLGVVLGPTAHFAVHRVEFADVSACASSAPVCDSDCAPLADHGHDVHTCGLCKLAAMPFGLPPIANFMATGNLDARMAMAPRTVPDVAGQRLPQARGPPQFLDGV